MKFRTEIQMPLVGLGGSINYNTGQLLVGSCFSDNIGAELQADLFDACVNPFGPLYNPRSIVDAFNMLAGEEELDTSTLFRHEGLWRSWHFHSRYADADKERAHAKMQQSLDDGRDMLKRASSIFITFGTTRVYAHRQLDIVVANCHKLPAKTFESDLLSLDRTTLCMEHIVNTIRRVNKKAKIILTVSPLRYQGEGVHGNSIIKSTLHLAVGETVQNNQEVYYFPAYEIMNDDLRDYRFYADDLLHPSQIAVEYIYGILKDCLINMEDSKIAKEARRLTRRLGHRGSSEGEEIKELEILKQYPQLMAGYNRLYNL